MKKCNVGIDPGKKGGITINFDGNISTWVMPMIGEKVYDIKALVKIFQLITDYDLEAKTHCVIEDVHAIYGSAATSTFEFGYGAGLLEGMLVMAGIPYTKVQPKKWQKEMFEGVPALTKPSSTGKTMKADTKKMAEISAKRLFPNLDLKASVRCKISHDGIVDSLLLSEFSRRNF